nr:hypothetical protein [Tanacetum cinerariifolium]
MNVDLTAGGGEEDGECDGASGRKVDGSIDKYKARLVIQGFRQKEGIDFFDTYAPVDRIFTIRLLLALAAIQKEGIDFFEGFVMPGHESKVCKLKKSLYGLKQAPKQWHQKFDDVVLSNAIYDLVNHQMNVKTAFLNGDLDEEIYMKQPEGVVMHGHESKVCKLKKSLISTIRLLLDLGAVHDLVIHQMDVKTAFLNGDLNEEIYMKQLEGFMMSGHESKVCKLKKSLYGLKQAPKQWHQKFDDVVLSNGFSLNKADKCVYSKFDASGKGVIICVYVDDMLIFGADQDQVNKTKEFLSSKFDMKDLGEAEDPRTLSEAMAFRDVAFWKKVVQSETDSIMYNVTWVLTDLPPGCKALRYQVNKTKEFLSSKFDIKDLGEAEVILGTLVSQLEYSRGIGCLMYAMISTRPDITFAIEKLSSGYPSVIEGYFDASWINNMEDHSFTSGWIFLLGGGVISCASKKQTCITSSTIESKFVALAAAGNKAKWLRNLIYEIPLWPKPISTISIRCDSIATLAKAYSQVYNDKSRYIGETSLGNARKGFLPQRQSPAKSDGDDDGGHVDGSDGDDGGRDGSEGGGNASDGDRYFTVTISESHKRCLLSEQEDLIVWMRTAALPTFRKLYGKIEVDLKASDTINVIMQNNYNTYSFNGKKKLVLSTSSWLGGKNNFIGIAYLAVGGLCFFLAIIYLVKPRRLGDPSYLSWNRNPGGH